MFSYILSGCKQLNTVLPKGPVVDDSMRQKIVNANVPNYQYSSDNLVDFPVIPFQIWGLTYDLDIIMVTEHPTWNMHEFAKITTPEGDVWLIKDAYEDRLNQVVTADIDDIHTWLPELPIKRKKHPIQVFDRSVGKKLDLEFDYVNHDNEHVKAYYKGPFPKTYMKKRNGSTMGHSRHQLLVALDLPYRDFGRKAEMRFDGKKVKMKRLLGLVPFQMALIQTQAGISGGEATFTLDNDHVRCERVINGEKVPMIYREKRNTDTLELCTFSSLREIKYSFISKDNELNLSFAEVRQYGMERSNVRLSFYPALPDLQKKFDQTYTSTFILDVGDMKGNAYGSVKVWWEKDQLLFEMIPEEPWWMLDRNMLTTLIFTKNNIHLQARMLSSQ